MIKNRCLRGTENTGAGASITSIGRGNQEVSNMLQVQMLVINLQILD